jgi:hypothetical protein
LVFAKALSAGGFEDLLAIETGIREEKLLGVRAPWKAGVRVLLFGALMAFAGAFVVFWLPFVWWILTTGGMGKLSFPFDDWLALPKIVFGVGLALSALPAIAAGTRTQARQRAATMR